MKPRALDLFCGAGGATRGLQLAGFHVTGVDIAPQPRYVGDAFHQADALTFPLDGFDLIWASPPCQGYSIMRNLPWLRDREYPLLIDPIRERLLASGAMYVIENVPGAPLNAFTLCGHSLGLPIFRHRLFEANFHVMVPAHRSHRGYHIRDARTLGGRAREMVIRRRGEPAPASREGHARARAALGVEWMRGVEHSQAIPPAYSEHIGRYALMALTPQAVAS